jgi:hypothetical protein
MLTVRASATTLVAKAAEWAWECEHESPAGLEARLAGLSSLADWPRPRRAVVELDGSLVQRRLLKELPPLSAAALRSTVEIQQRRLFRTRGEQLATSVRWVDGRAGGSAEAVAVDAAWLDAIARGFAEAGCSDVRIRSASGMTLPSPWQSAHGARRLRRVQRVLAAVALATWVAAAAVHAGRLMGADRRLTERLAELDHVSQSLVTARREIARVDNAVRRVDVAAGRRQVVSRLLGQLVKALPDSSFIERVNLRLDGGGSLAGAARSPSALMDSLARVPGLAVPRLEDGSGTEGEPGRWQLVAIRFGDPPR